MTEFKQYNLGDNETKIKFDSTTQLAIDAIAPLLQRLEHSIKESTRSIIESNKILAKSNAWFTGIIALAAIAQVIVTWVVGK